MTDEPFRFAINPVVAEENARRLIDTLAERFSNDGARSEDLRRQFEVDTGLKRQMYYDTLAYCKYRKWIVGGGKGVNYHLNEDCSWRPPKKEPALSTGGLTGVMNKDQLEHVVDLQTQHIEELEGQIESLRDFSGGSNGVALSNLVKIVADNSASTRQKLKACAAILSYQIQDTTLIEFVKGYLERTCASADNFDYRIEAGELLRRHEAPRISPETIRPNYRNDIDQGADRREAWRNYELAARELKIILETKDVPPDGWDDDLLSDDYVAPTEGWPGPVPIIPLKDLVVARRTRQRRMEREAIAELERTGAEPMRLAALRAFQRNGSGNGSDISR